MIAIIQNKRLFALPDTIDAQQTPSIYLYADVDFASNATVHAIDDKQYQIDLADLPDGFALQIADKQIIIYNTKPATDYLESWLSMQQLAHLIPICKKLGWHKLKEAALKARQMSDMQGTEQALQLLLTLLEIDNNVELRRYWRRTIADIDDLALEPLHSVDLANAGYILTGALRLIYNADRLNPWSETIEQSVQSMLLSLADVAEAIQGVLPATLRLSDFELLKVGLGCISIQYATVQRQIQKSFTDIDVSIDMPDVLQYSSEPFVYDLLTKRLLRVAPYSEQHAYSIARVPIDITVHGVIYDFCLHIDDSDMPVIQYAQLTGRTTFCIEPPLGKHALTYRYTTASGNRFEHSKVVQVLAACNKLPIYELTTGASGCISATAINAANISAMLMQYKQIVEACTGRPYALGLAKAYQQFFVPFEVKEIIVVRAATTVAYAVSIDMQIPDFTVSIEQLTSGDNVVKYYRLMTVNYAGMHDYTILYKTSNGTSKFDALFNVKFSRDILAYAPQLAKYLTDTVQPAWNALSIQQLVAEHNITNAILSINNVKAYHGQFMPVNKLDANFARRAYTASNVQVNMSDVNELASISTIANDADLTLTTDKDYSIRAVRRLASFSLCEALDCKDSVPYIAYKPNCWLHLYANETLITESYALLVFAKTLTAKYKLVIDNDWYSKTIEL